MLCNANTTYYVSKINKTLEIMKNEKKNEHIQNYDMDTIIKNQNNNKQWTHMLIDVPKKKLDTTMLEL
jgi:hypothetical protein